MAEGQLKQADVTLANAIGIPESALDGAQFLWPDLDPPPTSEALAPAQIKRAAVLNRLDLHSLLAGYAAAESALQLEIAKQYPDIQLGPGYAFEEAHNNFTLGLSATLPLFNRNQGPIAEAEAKREQTGAKFLALQAQIIGQSQKALAGYQAALAQLREADQLVQSQREGERLAARAFDAGASDKLTYTGAQLQVLIAARARIDALRTAQQALGDLESAVERPLQSSWTVGGLPDSSNSSIDLVKEGAK
jgi:outer membrane protein TolC